jgi:DNA-binding ferritin-like protein
MPFKDLASSFTRLFGASREEPPAPADPIAALDSAPPPSLLATAMGDADHAVRAAAIAKLTDGESLKALAGLSANPGRAVPPDLARMARQRLAQLIDAGAVDFDALCAAPGNSSALLAVASHCSDPERLSRALASIDDSEIPALVVDGPSSRVRQLAAQSVSDPAVLRSLVKQLRGKDKSVYKIIREKCDLLNAEEQRIEKIRSETLAACESLERHSHRIHDAIYEPTYRHFHSRWEGCASQAAAETQARAERAIERCAQIIAEHRERLALEATEASERAAREIAREEAARLAELESVRMRETIARETAEAAELREMEERARAEKLAADALAVREIGALIGRVQAALREGGTGRASGLRRVLEDKLSTVPHVPPPLARQLEKLDATLNELKDWKEHAAAPKRAELIGEMETLIGATLDPQALADRIRQLQNDWKTVSKGILSDSDADWQRFHQAAQSAYQPCREYFEAQAKLRQDNADKRSAILERLRIFEAAHGGGDADFRVVSTVLREAPQEWRQHFPVERTSGRKLQKEFDAAMGRLQARLDAWHTDNAARKAALARRAGELLALEDGREAAESIKRLQAQWKEIGAAPREQERGLWETFRGHCDAVFQKRQQAHASHLASVQANRIRAIELCEEVEALAAQSGPTLLRAATKVADWRSAFDSLGELTRGEERGLHARFERALQSVQTALSHQRAGEKERSLGDLLEAARRIHAYGWATAGASPEPEREALKRAAESFISGVSQWPKSAPEALGEAWAKAGAPSTQGSPVHERALRMLCIRGEILVGLPTPSEDQALRRDYQMHRLVERMGRQSEAAADSYESLLSEWVRADAVAPLVYESLLERFRRLRPPRGN